MRQQLPLEFKFNNEFTFDSFVPGANGELLEALKNISTLDDVPIVYFWGRTGTGKTHLLQALCQSPVFDNKPVALIPLDPRDSGEPYTPQILEGLEKMSLVCIDAVHCVAGNTEWENALFHFYNRARDLATPLVMCGNSPPAQLDIALPDLKTRIAWGLVLQLHALNDSEKLKAMRVRAKIRGIELNDEVGDYLLRRFSREMTDLIMLLDKLDKASLMEQRRLTIPFVKQFLENR